MRNGELICAFEEERLNRIKHWAGIPLKSIEQCMNHQNLTINNIDFITVNSNPYSNFTRKILYTIKSKNLLRNLKSFLGRQSKKLSLKKEIEKYFGKKLRAKIFRFDHHLSHIGSSYYLSGFKEATAVSIDGFGDFCSIAVASCKNNNIKIIKRSYYPNSLGVFYEGITQFLGFLNYGDEYKVMGLSAYGKPVYEELLDKLIKFDEDHFIVLDLSYFQHTSKDFQYKFDGEPKSTNLIDKKKLLDLLKINENNLNQFEIKSNIAASAQKIYEKIFFKIINKSLQLNLSQNLVLSGGCVMNCLANGKLIEKSKFKNIFVPYCPGDNGGALGSAALLNRDKLLPESFKNPYLGIRKKNKDDKFIEIIKQKKLFFKKYDDFQKINEKIVFMLTNEKIIANYRENMEFGSRALGNTSILCDPRLKNAKDIINSKVKVRESFRPFAPSILEEDVEEWFENKLESPYMSFVVKFKLKKKNLVPAVCHVDNTGRLQTVNKEINPSFYDLIKQFKDKTGIPMILNTSFNENEPIVESEERAIETYLRTSIDYLAINNYLISKNSEI
tara:strand:+ start:433 stop:2106 length:1674 start_codon:yes stop_codon:yes gene_type:complete